MTSKKGFRRNPGGQRQGPAPAAGLIMHIETFECEEPVHQKRYK